jgi:uncharacterized protein YehS (DUF1456 family)
MQIDKEEEKTYQLSEDNEVNKRLNQEILKKRSRDKTAEE